MKVSISLWRFTQVFFFTVTTCVVFALLSLFAAFGIVRSHMDDTALLPVDCAIVFGAAVYGNMYPGPAIVRRVATAAELYRAGKIHRLILSGGRGSGNVLSEAAVMKKEAIAHGVADEDIVLETQSHSTEENLLHSRNLTIGCNGVVGISDGYHLARIKLLARRAGYGDLPVIATGDQPEEKSQDKSVVRETFGYLYYFFHIDALIPQQAIDAYTHQQPQVPSSPGNP